MLKFLGIHTKYQNKLYANKKNFNVKIEDSVLCRWIY